VEWIQQLQSMFSNTRIRGSINVVERHLSLFVDLLSECELDLLDEDHGHQCFIPSFLPPAADKNGTCKKRQSTPVLVDS
jgi:hypothetical protein